MQHPGEVLTTSYSRRATGTFTSAPDRTATVVLLATNRDDELALLPSTTDTDGLAATLRAVGFTGRPGAVARVPLAEGTATVVGVTPDAQEAELLAAAASGVRASTGTTRVVVDVDVERTALYVVGLLATYRFSAYKAAADDEVEELAVVGDEPADKERLDDLVAAVCFARDLVTLPPADKTPQRVAELVEQAASSVGAECRVYDADEIREMGMGGLTAVGQASAHPPVLMRLHAPGTAEETVAVVGKGLTYDAGGLNIKLHMLEMMKLDIGGAAAAAGAVLHAAKHPRRRGMTAWLALSENVISGAAYHGGDVLRMSNGLSVEVANTDAEGRLVLADAMSIAGEEDPDLLLTIATLTGAAMAALGMRTAAVMSQDDALADSLLASAEAGREDLWRMPLRAHFAESLESQVADLNNLGDHTRGQTMVAATFLGRFAKEGTPYAHLDIAGPAYNPGKPYAHVPHGGTGYGVATLLELLDR